MAVGSELRRARRNSTASFHFDDFQAVFRGRLLSDAPELKAQDIKQIGFLIADKQPSFFELDLIQLHFKTSKSITSPEAD
ncbi:CIA30 family protein, partial [Vibrio splendidus]